MRAVQVQNPFPYAFKSLKQERTYNVKDHAHKLSYPLCRSLRGRRLKGRGKWIPGAREARKARVRGMGGFPSFLLPRARSCAQISFPLPFETLACVVAGPRIVQTICIYRRQGILGVEAPPPPPPPPPPPKKKLLSLQYISNYIGNIIQTRRR